MAKTILAIDDDEDILAILDILFVEEGYELISMTTGATSQQILVLHPDLILLDVRIAGFHKTGDQICTDIKSQAGLDGTPVLLLSAERELRWIAHSCGADAFLCKPFDLIELLQKVKQFIN